MSLLTIRELRLQRKTPNAVISIIVGESAFKGDANVIELRPGCQPILMDWRPVVGLWVAFYLLKPDWFVMDSAIQCASKAGAKLFGFVHAGKAQTLCKFEKTEDQNRAVHLMSGEWEAMCK